MPSLDIKDSGQCTWRTQRKEERKGLFFRVYLAAHLPVCPGLLLLQVQHASCRFTLVAAFLASRLTGRPIPFPWGSYSSYSLRSSGISYYYESSRGSRVHPLNAAGLNSSQTEKDMTNVQ